MDGSNETASASQRRREEIDDLLSGTFNSILRIEEQSLDNRLTHGLTITAVSYTHLDVYKRQGVPGSAEQAGA